MICWHGGKKIYYSSKIFQRGNCPCALPSWPATVKCHIRNQHRKLSRFKYVPRIFENYDFFRKSESVPLLRVPVEKEIENKILLKNLKHARIDSVFDADSESDISFDSMWHFIGTNNINIVKRRKTTGEKMPLTQCD